MGALLRDDACAWDWEGSEANPVSAEVERQALDLATMHNSGLERPQDIPLSNFEWGGSRERGRGFAGSDGTA